MIDTLKTFGDVLENVDLKNYNTYRISAIAKFMVFPSSLEDLQKLVKYLKENNIKYMVLGNGSNVIFNDTPYEGVIIKLDNLNAVEVEGLFISAEAGVMLPRLVQIAIDNNLKGLEWAQGIPGTIGGSVKGNAGAYKESISDYLVSVTVMNKEGEIQTLKTKEIDFSYRYSSFKDKYKDLIIISVLIGLMPGNKEESLRIIDDRRNRRIASQPLEYPSAGSVFRNPEGDAAGRIIEQEINFKGKKIGGAEVSKKHANFIINNGNASGKDVKDLIELIHKEVKEKTNIDLIVEQEFINWE